MLFAYLIMPPLHADVSSTCKAPDGLTAVKSLNLLPPAVLTAIKAKAPDIVDVGERFDATDFIVYRHSHRFMFAWSTGTRWVVAVEHGGYVYNNPIWVLQKSPPLSTTVVLSETISDPKSVCSTAKRLVATQ
jgi:hypothetical protein